MLSSIGTAPIIKGLSCGTYCREMQLNVIAYLSSKLPLRSGLDHIVLTEYTIYMLVHTRDVNQTCCKSHDGLYNPYYCNCYVNTLHLFHNINCICYLKIHWKTRGLP